LLLLSHAASFIMRGRYFTPAAFSPAFNARYDLRIALPGCRCGLLTRAFTEATMVVTRMLRFIEIILR
jgi:hypothetical protein